MPYFDNREGGYGMGVPRRRRPFRRPPYGTAPAMPLARPQPSPLPIADTGYQEAMRRKAALAAEKPGLGPDAQPLTPRPDSFAQPLGPPARIADAMPGGLTAALARQASPFAGLMRRQRAKPKPRYGFGGPVY